MDLEPARTEMVDRAPSDPVHPRGSRGSRQLGDLRRLRSGSLAGAWSDNLADLDDAERIAIAGLIGSISERGRSALGFDFDRYDRTDPRSDYHSRYCDDPYPCRHARSAADADADADSSSDA